MALSLGEGTAQGAVRFGWQTRDGNHANLHSMDHHQPGFLINQALSADSPLRVDGPSRRDTTALAMCGAELTGVSIDREPRDLRSTSH